MGLKAQGIITLKGLGGLRSVSGTAQAFPANPALNRDPPASEAVSRSASLFYPFMNPSSAPSHRWAR